MTPEELLRTRYIVEQYPHYPFDGNILLVDEHGELYHETEKYCESVYKIMEADIQNCINFKRLNWWDNRDFKELPLYVKKKDTGILFKVEGWRSSPNTAQITGAYINNDGNDFKKAVLFIENLLPASEDEYNEYYQITIKDKNDNQAQSFY